MRPKIDCSKGRHHFAIWILNLIELKYAWEIIKNMIHNVWAHSNLPRDGLSTDIVCWNTSYYVAHFECWGWRTRAGWLSHWCGWIRVIHAKLLDPLRAGIPHSPHSHSSGCNIKWFSADHEPWPAYSVKEAYFHQYRSITASHSIALGLNFGGSNLSSLQKCSNDPRRGT